MTEQMKSNDNLNRSKPPKPKLAISRNMVFGAGVLLAVVLVLVIMLRKRPSEITPLANSDMKASPGYAVTTLPETYADLPPPKPTQTPVVQVSTDQSSAALTKFLLQMEAENRKRRLEARKASLSFNGVSVAQGPQSDMRASLGLSESGEHGSEPTTTNARDEVNRQDDKMNFARTAKGDGERLTTRLRSPRSDYELMAGTLIPGVLLTGLNSDLPGQILGQVSQNVYDTVTGRYLLVPQGTKVLGQYDSRIVYGQERLLIVWTRLILPNGRSISLEGMPGVDLSGYAGLSDQVNNHYWRLLTGVVFSSVLGASAQLAEGRNYSSVDPSYSELATQGVARNMNEVGQQITRRNLNVQPTLEIRPGFRFNVFVHKDVVLEPYEL